MHTITYEVNGQKHAFDGDSVFKHAMTGKMFVRTGAGLLQEMTPAECKAFADANKPKKAVKSAA